MGHQPNFERERSQVVPSSLAFAGRLPQFGVVVAFNLPLLRPPAPVVLPSSAAPLCPATELGRVGRCIDETSMETHPTLVLKQGRPTSGPSDDTQATEAGPPACRA